jgi:hypothetical protein|tara:strand:- start:777 stop:920 length:144 start_codon:yes stop_codon:yes gene_type:complete
MPLLATLSTPIEKLLYYAPIEAAVRNRYRAKHRVVFKFRLQIYILLG